MKRRRSGPKTKLRRVAVWEIMDHLDISQNELARLAGMTSGHFSLLMNGERSPSPKARNQLQQALGVTDFDSLFFIEWDDE